MLQHVALPSDLSMDVRAVANLFEAISGYMEDLPCRKDNPKYKDNDAVLRANVPFTQMELCDMLKKSLPYAVQKLLASRSDKDEIFFDFTAFTNRVILTAEARLNPPKKKNDKTSEKNSDRNNSQKSGSPKKKNHQQNHQQSTNTNGNGKNCGRCAKEGKSEKCTKSHNDNDCHFFHANGTAKKSKQKPYDKKYEKKNFNHNLDDSFSAHEMKAIRKNLASHTVGAADLAVAAVPVGAVAVVIVENA